MTAAAQTPELDGIEHVVTELLDHIETCIDNHPRSQQIEIGPSELGNPCSRALLHALHGDKQPGGGGKWLATIGTAVHAWLEEQFTPLPRYTTEMTVPVGTVAGQPILGHVDLYDLPTATVVDWKVLGPDSLLAHAVDPGPQYITQLHLYGLGVAALGLPVRQVLLLMLPRNGALRMRRWWADDWRPDIARQALARAEGLATLLQVQPIQQAKQLFPLCDDRNCNPCTRDRNLAKPIPTTTAQLTAGQKERRP